MKYMVAEAKSSELSEVEDLFRDLKWKKIKSNHWISDEKNLFFPESWLLSLGWTQVWDKDLADSDNAWKKGKHRVHLVVRNNKANAYIGI